MAAEEFSGSNSGNIIILDKNNNVVGSTNIGGVASITGNVFYKGTQIVAQNDTDEVVNMGGVVTAKFVHIRCRKQADGSARSVTFKLTQAGPTDRTLPPCTELLIAAEENDDIIGIKASTQATGGNTILEVAIVGDES